MPCQGRRPMANRSSSQSRLKASSPATSQQMCRCRINCLFDGQSAHQVQFACRIGLFHFQQLIERRLRADVRAILAPGTIELRARRAEQAERWCSHGSCYVHLAAVIADKQGAMFQNGCGLQQVRAAGQVDEALLWKCCSNHCRKPGFIGRAQDNHMCIFKRAISACEPRGKFPEI